MSVIETRGAAWPIRALRWIRNTLVDFWCDLAPFIRREIDIWRG